MKKILTIFTLLLTASIFAQSATTTESPKVSYYISAGVSISNTVKNAGTTDQSTTNFSNASYPSFEVGATKGNLSLGAIVGRGNFNFQSDDISNYYYELKTTISQPVGNASIYGLFGLGNYVDTSNVFIEYGAGLSYTPKKLGYFIQASNWDGIWYLTPGLTYNF